MNGWTWASIDDLNALFNVYIDPAVYVLGPGPDTVAIGLGDPIPSNTDVGNALDAFEGDGWRINAGLGIVHVGPTMCNINKLTETKIKI